jgi:hypothetical protein
MGFSSMMAHFLVYAKVVEKVHMPWDLYKAAVVPIGVLYAVILALSNGTYMYLSVSFIQMIKAVTPASVFIVACFMGTETYTHKMAVNVALVVTGVSISAYGMSAINLWKAFHAKNGLIQ